MFTFTRTTAVFKCDYCGGGAESADLDYVKHVAADHLSCKPGFSEQAAMFNWYVHEYEQEVI